MTYITNIQDGFSSIFEEFKQAVVVTVVTRSMSDESEDLESESSTNTYAMIEYAGESYSGGRPGSMIVGDALAIFDYRDTINRRDYVTVGGDKYIVDTVIEATPGGTGVYKEAHLRLSD